MTQSSSEQDEYGVHEQAFSMFAESGARNYLSETILKIECGSEDVVTDKFGEVPGGMRLHVRYRGGDITLSKRNANAQGKHGFEQQKGRVLCGIDWVLLRRDAVAVFDSRLTFRLNDEKDKFVFDAVISGIVDLQNPDASADERLQTYRQWNQIAATLRVALPVRFEASGPSQNWAAKKYQVSAEKFAAYSYLTTNQFLAIGEVDVAPNTIKRIKLDVKMIKPAGA
jgi:hypothetical protein